MPISQSKHSQIKSTKQTLIISNKGVEIKNFLGEKYVRKIKALGGVHITTKDEAKDELEVRGIDLENTSMTCKHL